MKPGWSRTRSGCATWCRPEAMPFDNITKKHFDSGDYPECLRRAVAAIDLPAVRRRQAEQVGTRRMLGVGLAIFCEQAAHGTSVYAGWGIPMVPGFEQAVARMTPDGGLELRVGIQSHGQGLETTLAQVGHEMLGIPLDRIMVVHGDTALTPYSTGTWGSRCAGHGGRRGGDGLPRAGRPDRRDRRASAASAPETVRVGGWPRGLGERQRRHRRCRANLVSPRRRTCRRGSRRRAGGHRRLQAAARQRHVQLRRARLRWSKSIPNSARCGYWTTSSSRTAACC